MQFESWSEFIAMGGHGLYVWLCYATGLAVFLLLLWFPKRRQKQIIQELHMKASRPQVKTQSFGVMDIDSEKPADT